MAPMQIKEFFRFWKSIHQSFYNILEILEDKDLSYTFNEDIQTIGDLLHHIARTYHSWIGEVIVDGEEMPKFFKRRKPLDTVIKLKEAFDQSIERLNKYLEIISTNQWDKHFTGIHRGKKYDYTLSWILWHLIEHDIHHRAQIKMQLAFLGKKIKPGKFYG